MNPIDPDTQKYFDDYFDLFGSPGWAAFMNDLNVSLSNDQRTAASRCDTTEKWFEERGAQMKTARLINFENMIRSSYEQLIAEDELDSTEE